MSSKKTYPLFRIFHGRIFYGWYILAASFFLLFFQVAACFSFGIMFKPRKKGMLSDDLMLLNFSGLGEKFQRKFPSCAKTD